jgi:hypothetical protein
MLIVLVINRTYTELGYFIMHNTVLKINEELASYKFNKLR